MNISSGVSLVLSAAAFIASILANRRSVRASEAGSTLALVKDVFVRRHQRDFADALADTRRPDYAIGISPDLGFTGMSEHERASADTVANFFDDLGKLMAYKVIKEDIIIGTYGWTAIRSWTILMPFVLGQRAINQSSFNIYFEYLVRRAEANPADRIHRKLGLIP